MKTKKLYYETGELEAQGLINDSGNQEGEWLFYHKNGSIKIACNYLDGKNEGGFKRWNENGILVIECEYKNDSLDGLVKENYENGKPLEEGKYVNGEYFPINFWDIEGVQTLMDGTGYKTEFFGTGGGDVCRQYFENGKFIREEKLRSAIYGKFIPDKDE